MQIWNVVWYPHLFIDLFIYLTHTHCVCTICQALYYVSSSRQAQLVSSQLTVQVEYRQIQVFYMDHRSFPSWNAHLTLYKLTISFLVINNRFFFLFSAKVQQMFLQVRMSKVGCFNHFLKFSTEPTMLVNKMDIWVTKDVSTQHEFLQI